MPSFPPLHPAVVHFPIALIVFSVLVEFIAYFRPESKLKGLAKWTMVGACIGGILTVIAGLIDINRLPGHNAYVHFHMQVGFVLFSLLVGLTVWRWFIDRFAAPIPKLYLTGAAMLFLLTLFQGWLGGELVFSHGFAVAPTENRMEPPELAQSRLRILDPLVAGTHGDAKHSPAEDHDATSDHSSHADTSNEPHAHGGAEAEDSGKPVVTEPNSHPGNASAPKEQGKDAAQSGPAKDQPSVERPQSLDSVNPHAMAHGSGHSKGTEEPIPVSEQRKRVNSYEYPEETQARKATAEELKRDGIVIPTANDSADKRQHQH